MPRKSDMRGIETRLTADGREQYRAYVKHPHDRHGKVRGPWTYNFAEAKGWRIQTLAKADRGEPLLSSRKLPTVAEAAKAFIAGARSGAILSRKRERYAAKTLRNYEQGFRDWIYPEIGHIRIHALRRSEVQRMLDAVVAAEKSGSTARNVVHALGALYSYLLPRHDEIGHDPTAGLVKPRANGPRERYAEPDEIEALLRALPRELVVPYALAFLAGLRRSEIRCLPLDCIDLEQGWIDVRYSLDASEGFKGPKSGAGTRSVPIFDGLRPYLAEQVAETMLKVGTIAPSTQERPGTLLLPSTRESRFGTRELGTPYFNLCRKAWGWKWVADEDGSNGRWEKVRKDALEPIGLHEARHSFATALVRAGYDVKTVSEWIGHAQASTTLNVYAKRRGRHDDVGQLATSMNRYLAGASAPM